MQQFVQKSFQRFISVKATRIQQENLRKELNWRRQNGIKKVVYTPSPVTSNSLLKCDLDNLSHAKLRQILDETVDVEDGDINSNGGQQREMGVKTKLLNVTESDFMKAIYETMQKLILMQDGKEMENILKLLLSRNIAVSNQIIHIMLKYYAVNGPIESAENLIEYWKSKTESNPPSSSASADTTTTDTNGGELNSFLGEECYHELIDGYANFNLPWKSLHVLQTMEKENIPISLQALNKVVRAFGKAREKKGIDIVLGLMDRKGFVQKNLNSYNVLLNTMKETRNIERAMTIFEEMKQASEANRSLTPNLTTYTIMMEIFSKKGDLQSASEIVQDVVSSSLEPDTVLFNVLLHAYRKRKKYADVEYYYQLMQNCGLTPTVETYAILISMYGLDQTNLKKAMQVYQEMISREILPNRFLLGTLMSVALVNRDYVATREWYRVIEERGMVPTTQILMTIMQLEMIEFKQKHKQQIEGDKVEMIGPEKLISKGAFYFDLAQKLRLVNQDLCKQYALVHLIAGSSVKEAINVYMKEMRAFSNPSSASTNTNTKGYIRVPGKTVLLFADYVLRKRAFFNEYLLNHFHTLRAEPILTTMQASSSTDKKDSVPPIVEKGEGKKEFLDLMDLISSPPSAERKKYLHQAIKYLYD